MSTSAAATAGSNNNEAKPTNKVDLGLLEEDDEFEEFPADEYPHKGADDEEEVKVWEDNWDDDNIEDDFSVQLKAELEKQGFLKGGAGSGEK